MSIDLQLLKAYALSLVGTPYYFGGDDPISGFDCSGLACELLRSAGVVPWNFRTNAQGLFVEVSKTWGRGEPELGALAFYGPSVLKIDHVAFCLDNTTMVEAGGGDATTLSPEVASRQNAFVRLRPIHFRKDFLCCLKPLK